MFSNQSPLKRISVVHITEYKWSVKRMNEISETKTEIISKMYYLAFDRSPVALRGQGHPLPRKEELPINHQN